MVKITLLNCGAEVSPELNDARRLEQSLNDYFAARPKISGNIGIVVNSILYGNDRNQLDIIVVGSLDSCNINLVSQYYNSYTGMQMNETKINVNVQNFCLIIEHKRQPHDKVECHPQEGVSVYYPSTDTKENVSDQVKSQCDSLRRDLNYKFGSNPFIVGLIWLVNINNRQEVTDLTAPNVLFKEVDFENLIYTACKVSTGFQPVYRNGNYTLSATNYNHNVDSITKYLKQISQPPKRANAGQITRDRLERMTSENLKFNLDNLQNQNGILVYKGQAGTGKTSVLLRIAQALREEQEARCLILTYNKALVGDLNRTYAFLGQRYRPDGDTIEVSTMQSFFINIMKHCGIDYPIGLEDYQEKYTKGMSELSQYFRDNVITEEDIKEIKRKDHRICWDYVFVDEGQDWTDDEVLVLKQMFANGHLVVADGVDQIVRGGNLPQNWLRGTGVKPEKYKVGLRQSTNLMLFANMYANTAGIDWNLEPGKNNLSDGYVEIYSSSDYFAKFGKFIKREIDNIGEKNCPYDLMVFVPNQLTENDNTGTHLCCDLKKQLDDYNVEIFDGTNDRERGNFSIDKPRFFQYESCRGLEAWTVICLDFDVFIQNRMDQYVDVPNENVMNTEEDRRRENVGLWSMIPLTRPICRLIITVRDPNSVVANTLRSIKDSCRDFMGFFM